MARVPSRSVSPPLSTTTSPRFVSVVLNSLLTRATCARCSGKEMSVPTPSPTRLSLRCGQP